MAQPWLNQSFAGWWDAPVAPSQTDSRCVGVWSWSPTIPPFMFMKFLDISTGKSAISHITGIICMCPTRGTIVHWIADATTTQWGTSTFTPMWDPEPHPTIKNEICTTHIMKVDTVRIGTSILVPVEWFSSILHRFRVVSVAHFPGFHPSVAW